MENLFTKNSETLNRFLFTKVNPFYSAIFRIILCLFISYIFFFKTNIGSALHVFAKFSPEVYEKYFIVILYKALCLISLFMFGIGFKSRLSGLISTLLLFPLMITAYVLLQSKILLLLALFFFSLVRSDELLSIKRLFNKTGNVLSSPMWPIRLIQIELSLLYGVNAILKTTPDFLSGEVLRIQSIVLENYQVDLSAGYLDLGFLTIPVMFLAIGTVLSEYFLAIGFWFKKTRIFTALFGLVFHGILTQVVSIRHLDVVSVFLYLSFLIPWEKSGSNIVDWKNNKFFKIIKRFRMQESSLL